MCEGSGRGIGHCSVLTMPDPFPAIPSIDSTNGVLYVFRVCVMKSRFAWQANRFMRSSEFDFTVLFVGVGFSDFFRFSRRKKVVFAVIWRNYHPSNTIKSGERPDHM